MWWKSYRRMKWYLPHRRRFRIDWEDWIVPTRLVLIGLLVAFLLSICIAIAAITF